MSDDIIIANSAPSVLHYTAFIMFIKLHHSRGGAIKCMYAFDVLAQLLKHCPLSPNSFLKAYQKADYCDPFTASDLDNAEDQVVDDECALHVYT